jgi:hypothetical protein
MERASAYKESALHLGGGTVDSLSTAQTGIQALTEAPVTSPTIEEHPIVTEAPTPAPERALTPQEEHTVYVNTTIIPRAETTDAFVTFGKPYDARADRDPLEPDHDTLFYPYKRMTLASNIRTDNMAPLSGRPLSFKKNRNGY